MWNLYSFQLKVLSQKRSIYFIVSFFLFILFPFLSFFLSFSINQSIYFNMTRKFSESASAKREWRKKPGTNPKFENLGSDFGSGWPKKFRIGSDRISEKLKISDRIGQK